MHPGRVLSAEPNGLEERLRAALAPNLLLVRELGAGGMARVFLAREPALKRLVAVKVLSADYAATADGRARFEREAQAVASLSHPNIVAVHVVGELSDGTPYFVMQYVSGRTIADRIKEEGPLSIAETRRILSEVAAALAAAHAQGIIHRDIKPANVLYEEATGRSLVSDFGIAAIAPAGPAQSVRLTSTGMLVGTPMYMSPEQLLAEPITEKTDIYSLGLLAHELVTGSGPFKATTPHELIAAHLRDTPKRLSERRMDVDTETDALVVRCLDKDASLRPAAEEVARRLSPGGVALLEWPPPGLEDLHGGLRRVSTMHWLGGALVGAAVLALTMPTQTVIGTPQSAVALLLLIALVAGALVLGVAAHRTMRVGVQTTRALRAGYAWMTILETLADRKHDTGNVISGSREYASLSVERRNGLRMLRVVREVALFVGAIAILPLLVVAIVFGSAGVAGPEFIWAIAVLALGALAVAVEIERRERLAVGSRRQRRSETPAADGVNLADAWYGSFESMRTGQRLGRGVTSRSSAGRIGALASIVLIAAVLVVLGPAVLVGIFGSTFLPRTFANYHKTEARLRALDAMRETMLPKNSGITPLAAGRAFYALTPGAKHLFEGLSNRAFPELPPPAPLDYSVWNSPLPPRLFEKLPLKRMSVAGMPFTMSALDAAMHGFTPAEATYLERLAHADQWRYFDLLARAPDIDVVGARYQLPFGNARGNVYDLFVDYQYSFWPLARADLWRAAYHLSRGARDSAETSLRALISVGFLLVDHSWSLSDEFAGEGMIRQGGEALLRYYALVGDKRGVALQEKNNAVVSALEIRADSDTYAARDARVVRASMIQIANDRSQPRGLRFQMLTILAGTPCTTLRELVYGPDEDVRIAFADARNTWARFASDTALLDLAYRTPAILAASVFYYRPDDATSSALQAYGHFAAAVFRNPRLETCLHVALQR